MDGPDPRALSAAAEGWLRRYVEEERRACAVEAAVAFVGAPAVAGLVWLGGMFLLLGVAPRHRYGGPGPLVTLEWAALASLAAVLGWFVAYWFLDRRERDREYAWWHDWGNQLLFCAPRIVAFGVRKLRRRRALGRIDPFTDAVLLIALYRRARRAPLHELQVDVPGQDIRVLAARLQPIEEIRRMPSAPDELFLSERVRTELDALAAAHR